MRLIRSAARLLAGATLAVAFAAHAAVAQDMTKDSAMAKEMDGDAMMDDASMKKSDAMMKKGDAMMKDGAIAMGRLTGAEGHDASGSVRIERAGDETRLHLSDDFTVEKGPDVFVVLSRGPKVRDGASLFVAKLDRFSGAQSVTLPPTADPAAFDHVVLWCRKYSVAMGVAPLESHAMHDMKGKAGAMNDEMKQN